MSLSGWIALLDDEIEEKGARADPLLRSAVGNMRADLERLERVAHRFERIGRPPRREPAGRRRPRRAHRVVLPRPRADPQPRRHHRDQRHVAAHRAGRRCVARVGARIAHEECRRRARRPWRPHRHDRRAVAGDRRSASCRGRRARCSARCAVAHLRCGFQHQGTRLGHRPVASRVASCRRITVASCCSRRATGGRPSDVILG